jgi:hypothetical protein
MIYKIKSSGNPSFIEQVTIAPGTLGWKVNFYNGGSDLVSEGDYVSDEGNEIKIIKASDYNSNAALKQFIREKIGKQIVIDLYDTLESQGLSNAVESSIISTVLPVLVALGFGWIKGARVTCNNLPTTADFTAARKTFILNKIDVALVNI